LAATIAGVVTLASAVLLATAPATSATALPPEGGRATASLPPLSVPSERIIWWGPPPIWTPPKRTRPALASTPVPVVQALAGRARPELTWTPAQLQPVWTPPLRPDTDAVPAAAASEWPAQAASEWPAQAASEWPAPAASEWPAPAASEWPDARPWDAYADDVPEPVRVTRPQSRPSLRPWDDL
jgi:hypothetical protein